MTGRVFETRSADKTRALACALGRVLGAGDVICLSGDLGAGKTTFTQGLALGLGIPADVPVRSPTFTLVAEYADGRLPLFHFDVYRLADSSGLADLAFDEYLDAGGVVVIEWPGKVADALPEDRLDVSFTSAEDSDTRTITMTPRGAWAHARLTALEAAGGVSP